MPYDGFRDLVNVSPIFQMLKGYGASIVPLSLVGLYMNYAGNHLLHYIYQTYKQKVFHHGHKVVGIQLLATGEVLTSAIRKVTIVKKNELTGSIKFVEKD